LGKNIISLVCVLVFDIMEYPTYVEVCGNCGSMIRWDKNGDPVCNCGNTLLQFMARDLAISLKILEAN